MIDINITNSQIMTDNEPNYSYINAHKKLKEKVAKAIKENKTVTYCKNFVQIDGQTFNIRPEVVREIEQDILNQRA